MTQEQLLSIGAFARASGLTTSALRFYQDSGLLAPAEVDDASGYRYYAPGQVPRAVLIRRLRELDLPLADIAQVLAVDAASAGRLIDEHVTRLAESAARARETAAEVKARLAGEPAAQVVAALRGPVLAAAIDQVLTATASDPEFPSLGGVRLEVSEGMLTLTATDRYRLVTRTVVSDWPATWAGTLDGGDLRTVLPVIRRESQVRLEADTHGIRLAGCHCRVLGGEFPAHRAMFEALPEPVTRVTVERRALLAALETQSGDEFALGVGPDDLGVGETRVPARVVGPGLEIWFRLTTLYPAVSSAFGPDVLLDLRGADQAVTVRSADDGDLTTALMPVRAPTLTSP